MHLCLDQQGCSYDNAATEFVKGRHFDILKELELELMDYTHWYNHIRIHGTLGYKSPIQYKLEQLKKVV
ncbi:IS3 family transposase [Brevibacillus laterosporus]|uniref:IS3 family transposase n=1 Tax=Brevibacillus laterosporus TaxID=1465 RepID=UPI003D1D2AFA